MRKFGFTKKRLFACICVLFLPVLSISLGIMLLCAGTLPTISLAYTYFIVPITAATGLGCAVFYNTKTLRKVITSVLILIAYIFLFAIGYICGEYTMIWHFEDKELETKYTEISETKKLMPSLTEIGNPIDIDYYNIYIQYFVIFTPETDYLICEYSPEEYKTQKNLLSKKYIFQEKELSNFDASCESITEIDGFTFKSLSIDEESYKLSINYPKTMVIIGFSDESNEIIYMSFYDDDIDYITTFSDFINEECGWKYIRKEILNNK